MTLPDFCFFVFHFSFIYPLIRSFLCSYWPLLRHTISNNRPSTAPRGLQHAILNISISAGLFGRVCVYIRKQTMSHHHHRKERWGAKWRGGRWRRSQGMGSRKQRENRSKFNKTEFSLVVHENISMCCSRLVPAGFESETTSCESVTKGNSNTAGNLLIICVFERHSKIQTHRRIFLFDLPSSDNIGTVKWLLSLSWFMPEVTKLFLLLCSVFYLGQNTQQPNPSQFPADFRPLRFLLMLKKDVTHKDIKYCMSTVLSRAFV